MRDTDKDEQALIMRACGGYVESSDEDLTADWESALSTPPPEDVVPSA